MGICSSTKKTKRAGDYEPKDFPLMNAESFLEFKKNFISADNVKKGYLTKNELCTLFTNNGVDLPPTAIAGQMVLVDENKDGLLQFEEYMAQIAKMTQEGHEDPTEVVYTTKEGIQVTRIQNVSFKSNFSFYSKNKIGFLSFSEYIKSIEGIRNQLSLQGLLEGTGININISDTEKEQYKMIYDKTVTNQQAGLNYDEYVKLSLYEKERLKTAEEVLNQSNNQ